MLTFLGDVLHYRRLALIDGFAIGKANDGIARFVEVRGAGLIVFDLLGVGAVLAKSCRSAVAMRAPARCADRAYQESM